MKRCTLKVRVIPKSAQNTIVGWHEDALKVKVQAPPEDGKANKAVIALLAKQVGLAAKYIHVKQGHAYSNKVLEIEGLTEEELLKKLP